MSKLPDHKTLYDTILKLREDYAAEGISLYDIGNGYCYDFADRIMDAIFPENWIQLEGTEDWGTLQTECFYLPGPDGFVDPFDCSGWDFSLLESWGIEIPEEEHARYNRIISRHPAHGWVYFKGKHYDAEHPEGVTNFFDLSFFARFLEKTEAEHTQTS